jgi:hypothetical protein
MLRRSAGLWAEVRSCKAQITDFFVRWASAARSEIDMELSFVALEFHAKANIT